MTSAGVAVFSAHDTWKEEGSAIWSVIPFGDYTKELGMQEFEPVQRSLLSWMYAALGFKYALLLPLSGMLSFVLALIIVIRGRGPMTAVALLLIVHVPMLIGIFAALEGVTTSFTVISMSDSSPKPSQVATGISMALVAPTVGMLVMVPGYALAAIGSIVRSLSANSSPAQ